MTPDRPTRSALSAAVREAAVPLSGVDDPCDAVLEVIGDARIVLLGEASHGTHEFYRMRAHITRRLIAERGFAAVAIEGDWPDAYRVNRHVRGQGDDADADAALSGFKRFPTWMWRNTEVAAFVGWLRAHNATRPPEAQTGFYGIDLYSLHASMEAVLRYLERTDPAMAQRARDQYGCFEPHGHDTQRYGWLANLGATPSCEREVVAMLVDLRRQAAARARTAGSDDAEAAFDAAQNALLVRNAERYYRSLFARGEPSWNLRDRHMAESLTALEHHLDRDGRPARLVVWAHNSHLGDARATEMAARGELNLGQLVRDWQGRSAVSIGFSTHHGTVFAADDWDTPGHVKAVRPGLPGSLEAVMHGTGLPAFLLPLHDGAPPDLHAPRLQRAIGVIYRPETERQSHYFHAELPAQFDALVHLDATRALRPLDHGAWADRDVPEAYPSGL